MVLNARTLMRVALAMDLPWRPATSSDYLVVSRAASIVDQDIIDVPLRDALLDKGVSGEYEISYTGGAPEMILPADMPASAEITRIEYNHETNWFEADIAAPSAENPRATAMVTGRIERLMQVPVLKDTMRTGSMIRSDDIEYITMRTRSVNHDVILDRGNLYGMTPRRMIQAGKPIKEQDVEYPRIVSRGDEITMVFKNGPLKLTARGKALESGSKGEIIRVVNGQSNRTLEATISGEREVTVARF
jgi:flagella basal body P-ring formation protein FlgA